MIWGDYGRMDKKAFMGVVQIVLDDLDLTNITIGWYKLFNASSVINLNASGKSGNGNGSGGGGGGNSGSGGGGSISGGGSIGGGSLMSASMESFS